MKKYLVTVSSFVLLATGSVQAADIVNAYPKQAAVFSWSGFYLGAQLGGAFSTAKYNSLNPFDAVSTIKAKSEGFIGGLYGGYNFDFSDFTVGVETDLVSGNVRGRGFVTEADVLSIDGVMSVVTAGDILSIKQKWAGATRLRVGTAYDRLLPYAAAGVAYGKLELDTTTTQLSKTRIGWTGGVGVDYAVSDALLLRGEYRYTDFGKWKSDEAQLKYAGHDFRIGVAYKF